MQNTKSTTEPSTDDRYADAKVLFNKTFAKAYLYEIENALIFELKWIGFVESQDFRDTLDECIPLVLKYKPTHWLGNNKLMRVIAPKDQEWTSEYWFPQLLQNNFKKMAIVEAQDLFNKRGVQKIFQKAGSIITFDIMYFDDVQKARAWLTGE
ncbi:MAG TPA: STAS/SEC14 domain-containing protein [Patescibacteria group bacterium]|nr:STAS/SEC14 domain-containing protein [Patescibacteria group bacterium]